MTPEEFQRLTTDARPRLAWRIGISGHRTLAGADPIELQRALDQVFDNVAAALAEVQEDPCSAMLFAPAPPLIALVSPLAEGADRFCAELAVKRGFELRAPLPFDETEYKKDFPDSLPAFDRLLAHARSGGGAVELDGRPEEGEPRNESYMAVGEFVLRNCDLLIVIWDGKEARGWGGTAHVIERARQLGMPVVHVRSTDPHPIMMREADGSRVWKAYSPKALSQSIAGQIIPKVRATRHHASPDGEGNGSHHGAKHKLRRPTLRPAEIYFRNELLADTGKEPDFIYEGPLAPRMNWVLGALASIFPAFVKALGTRIDVDQPVKSPPPVGPKERTARYLFLHHHRADILSTFYANVHRSAFLCVYVLGALALSFAVAAIEFHDLEMPISGIKGMYVFTALEFVVLGLLATLVDLNNRLRWRDRWLEYRLLAELLREADLLAQVGRPMPIAKIDELSQDLPGRAWVTIAYCAIIRRAGIVSQKFDAAFLERVRDYAADTRLQDQIAYHLKAEARNETIGKKLRTTGLVAFILTMLVAAAKLSLSWIDFVHALHLGLFAGVLPALAYACFGIRNQAEFEIVSRRSERMIVKLSRHKERIKALQGETLTSDALGREILNAAGVMRHDAADWASIFEVKETEAG